MDAEIYLRHPQDQARSRLQIRLHGVREKYRPWVLGSAAGSFAQLIRRMGIRLGQDLRARGAVGRSGFRQGIGSAVGWAIFGWTWRVGGGGARFSSYREHGGRVLLQRR